MPNAFALMDEYKANLVARQQAECLALRIANRIQRFPTCLAINRDTTEAAAALREMLSDVLREIERIEAQYPLTQEAKDR